MADVHVELENAFRKLRFLTYVDENHICGKR